MGDRPVIAPNAVGRAIRFCNPKVGMPVTTLILGPCYGIMVHPVKKGSPILCLGDDCPAPVHRGKPWWKGYYAAEQWFPQESQWWPTVLEVTPHAQHQLESRTNRGELWVWAKDGADKSAPMVGKFLERFGEDDCGVVFDLAPILIRFYRVLALPPSCKNPIPPPTLIAPREGRAPALSAHQQPAASGTPEPCTPEEFAEFRGKLADSFRANGRRPRV